MLPTSGWVPRCSLQARDRSSPCSRLKPVAGRGSGPGAKWRRPCPSLRATTARKRRDEERPDPSTPGLQPRSNKRLTGKRAGRAGRHSLPRTLHPAWVRKQQRSPLKAVSGLPRGSGRIGRAVPALALPGFDGLQARFGLFDGEPSFLDPILRGDHQSCCFVASLIFRSVWYWLNP